MPVAQIPLSETDQLVARPVIVAVLEQIKQITNIPQDTDIVYIGENNQRIPLTHPTSSDQAPVKLASDNAVKVEVEEEADDGMFATTAGNMIEHNPDFVDKALGVYLKPIYCGMNITLRVVFRTSSRAEAIRWRDEARFKSSQMRTYNLHEVNYKYQIPPRVMELLKHIHEKREAAYGYNEDFMTYLSKHLTTRATQVSNQNGTFSEIMIEEKVLRIVGEFDFRANPAKQEKNEGEGWEVSFNYTFSYHKPVMYNINYPILIHQQTIDPYWIPELPKDTYEEPKRLTHSMDAFYYMEAPVIHARQFPYDKIYYAPEQDTWLPNLLPSHHRMIASLMVTVKDESNQVLLNLNNLGDYEIDPAILQWIALAEHPYINNHGYSAMGIALFRNECLASPQSISVKSNGDVVLLNEADCRKRYRVAITLAKSLRSVPADSLDRLAAFPDAMCQIMKVTLTKTGDIHDLLAIIDLTEFSHCAVNGGISYQQGIDQIVRLKTVMQAGIIAHRI